MTQKFQWGSQGMTHSVKGQTKGKAALPGIGDQLSIRPATAKGLEDSTKTHGLLCPVLASVFHSGTIILACPNIPKPVPQLRPHPSTRPPLGMLTESNPSF